MVSDNKSRQISFAKNCKGADHVKTVLLLAPSPNPLPKFNIQPDFPTCSYSHPHILLLPYYSLHLLLLCQQSSQKLLSASVKVHRNCCQTMSKYGPIYSILCSLSQYLLNLLFSYPPSPILHQVSFFSFSIQPCYMLAGFWTVISEEQCPFQFPLLCPGLLISPCKFQLPLPAPTASCLSLAFLQSASILIPLPYPVL